MESKVTKLIKTESRIVMTRGWEGVRDGELLVKGYKVSVMEDKVWRSYVQNATIVNTVLYT